MTVTTCLTERHVFAERKEKLTKGIIESDNEDAETKTTVISDDEEEEGDEDDVDEDYDSEREAVDNFIEEDGKMTEEQRDEREAEMPVEYTRHGKLELDDHVRYFVSFCLTHAMPRLTGSVRTTISCIRSTWANRSGSRRILCSATTNTQSHRFGARSMALWTALSLRLFGERNFARRSMRGQSWTSQ